MLTRRLVVGEHYEVERNYGNRVRACYLGPNEEDPLDNPLVFMEHGVSSPIGRFTTTPRYVIRPWTERVTEQRERAEREAEVVKQQGAMFTALYGNLPHRVCEALGDLGISVEYRAMPDIAGMTCALDIEGTTKVMSGVFVNLLSADAGTVRRLPLIEPLAEYHALLLAGQDVRHVEGHRVGAVGRFSPVELATLLHVANGLRSC